MLWDPFLYCINDSIQGNSETGNKVFVLPSKVAINSFRNKSSAISYTKDYTLRRYFFFRTLYRTNENILTN